MPDTKPAPITVNANAGVNDLLFAALRYIVVIATAFPTLLVLLKDHDIAAIHAYFTSDAGKAVVAAAISLGTLAYGLYKTHKRGAQVATVAGDSRVPNTLAKLK